MKKLISKYQVGGWFPIGYDDNTYRASYTLPEIKILSDRPEWQNNLTDYDLARLRSGQISAEIAKSIAQKRATGTSGYMKDVNKLSWIPNGAMILAGGLSGALANPYLWGALGLGSAAQNIEDKNYREAALDIGLTFLGPELLILNKGVEATRIGKSARIASELNKVVKSTRLQPGVVENSVHNRFKLGDVEINNPNLMYHVDNGDYTGFSGNGAYVKDGMLFPSQHIRYYESPNKEAMKGVKYIEQTPSSTSLDAEQQLAQRLKSYIPKVGENGLVEYKPLNSSDVINIPEKAVEKQIQKYIDSGIAREDAIERLREQFGYGAMTSNGKTFLLPEKYMITNPEYMKAHDAVHRVLRFDNSFNIPGAEGLNPNEAAAMISGEIKPALGIQANEPLTEKMLDKWLKATNDKITGRYGFSSKIKNKKKFLEWANKVAPVWLLGGYGAYKVTNNNSYKEGVKLEN